jgi:hypothetical protein
MAIKQICPVLMRIVITIAMALAKPLNLVALISAAFPVEYAEILDPWAKGVQ